MDAASKNLPDLEFNMNARRQRNGLYGMTLYLKNFTAEDMAKLAYYFELGDLPELGSLVVRGLAAVTAPEKQGELKPMIRAVITQEMGLLGAADWAGDLATR